jgi:hypothetical protein
LPEHEHLKESYYQTPADERGPMYDYIDINKSALVHFRKRIEGKSPVLPVIPEEVSAEVRDQLVKNLIGYTYLGDRGTAEEVRAKVAVALQNAMSGGIEQFDATEVDDGYTLRDIYEAGKRRVSEYLGKWQVVGRRDENGKVASIAAYKEEKAKWPDGRAFHEITKVSRLKDAKGRKLGVGAMDDVVEYLQRVYPDSPISTASKNPIVIDHFKAKGWKSVPFGDVNDPMSILLSGTEPDNSDPKWKKEWRKMRDGDSKGEGKYICLYFDPLPLN